MQVSFGMGFIGIASDLVNIVRVLLVNPTYGSETYAQSPAACAPHAVPLYRPGDFPGEPPEGTPDHPRQRRWSRRFCNFVNLAFFAATIPGILANSRFSSVLEKPRAASRTARLR